MIILSTRASLYYFVILNMLETDSILSQCYQGYARYIVYHTFLLAMIK